MIEFMNPFKDTPINAAFIGEVYADGGVIGPNPSLVGGAWAYCYVSHGGDRVVTRSGRIDITEAYPIPYVENNFTESVALARALYYLPDNWRGTVATDNQNALRRIFGDYACNALPGEWITVTLALRAKWKDRPGVKAVLLQGHPRPAELAAGRGESGRVVSAHNVWCDNACKTIAQAGVENYRARTGKLPERYAKPETTLSAA